MIKKGYDQVPGSNGFIPILSSITLSVLIKKAGNKMLVKVISVNPKVGKKINQFIRHDFCFSKNFLDSNLTTCFNEKNVIDKSLES